ncbi:hypothetical protein [Kribbella sp. NBC_00359]|uniref:hypothetical protein n=1 Tax=Kribbella sp. NBC_00359 TaxID=2975966 RepID=UPI002E1ADFB2
MTGAAKANIVLEVTVATLAYLPAIPVVIGLAAAFFGLKPAASTWAASDEAASYMRNPNGTPTDFQALFVSMMFMQTRSSQPATSGWSG